MKFAALANRYSVAVATESSDLNIEFSDTIFSETQKDIQYSIESAEIAQRDLEILARLESVVGTGKMNSVSLETACIGLNIINRRYGLESVATEGIVDGIKNATAKVIKFFSDCLKYVSDKFKSMLGNSDATTEKAIESTKVNIEKLDSIRKDSELLAELEEEYSKEKNNLDAAYKNYKEKGTIEFKIKGKYKPKPYDYKGLSSAVALMDKASAALAASVSSIIALSDTFITEAEKLSSSQEVKEEVLNDLTSKYMQEFTAILVKTGMRESKGEDGSTVYSTDLAISHNVSVAITTGPSFKDHRLKVEPVVAANDTNEGIFLNEDQFKRVFSAVFSSSVGANLKSIAEDTSKLSEKADALHKRINGQDAESVASIRELSSFITSVLNKAVQTPVQMAASLKGLLTSLSAGCLYYSQNVVKYNSEVVLDSQAKESVSFENTSNYISLENVEFDVDEILAIESEANLDFNLAMEAFTLGKNYIDSGNIQMSLEGYLDHLQTKYSSFNISLENDKDIEVMEREEEKSEKSGGLIGFFKAVFKFISRVLKTIWDKIMYLIRGDKSRTKDGKDKMEKVSKMQKEIAKEGIPKEKKKKVKEEKEKYSPEVVDYFEKGRFSFTVTNESYSLGKNATIKDLQKAVASYEDALDRIPLLFLSIANIPSNISRSFTEAMNKGIVVPVEEMEEFKSNLIVNLVKVIDEDGVKPAWPDQNKLTISNFCNSYMVVDQKDFRLNYGTLFVPTILKPDDFSNESTIEVGVGELGILSKALLDLYKYADIAKEKGTETLKKINSDKETFSSVMTNYIVGLEKRGLENTDEHRAIRSFFKYYRDYLVNLSLTVGKLTQRLITMRMFLEKVIEKGNAIEVKLREAKPKTEEAS